jgi:polyketide biosynthesis acyl carrier protein
MNNLNALISGVKMKQEDIFDLIVRHTSEIVPKLQDHNFQQNDSLKDLGANSVDRSEIIMMTLESLSIKIPLTVTASAQNMGELASIIHGKL